MTIDEHVDQRARAASAALRRWDPAEPPGTPYERIGSAARRRRTARLAVAAAVVVAGTGRGHPGPRRRAAGGDRPRDRRWDGPRTGRTHPLTTASTLPPAGETTESCRGTLPSEVDDVLHFPLGWHTNRGRPPSTARAPSYFGPDPSSLQRDDQDVESVANSVVTFEPVQFPERAPDRETFIAAVEGRVYPAWDGVERLSVERHTVAGRPALRELTHPDGRRWVSWYVELDGIPLHVNGAEGHGGL